MGGLGKEAMVSEMADMWNHSSSLLVSSFQGLKVSDIEHLRSELGGVPARFFVIKNSLARQAFEKAGFKDIIQFVDGSSAVTFTGEDSLSVCKVLADFARGHEEFTVRGGIIDGSVVGWEEVETLARLTSREALLGKLVTGFNCPLSGLVGSLGALLRKLVTVVDAIARQKK